jgi:hypothetical protein
MIKVSSAVARGCGDKKLLEAYLEGILAKKILDVGPGY